jgi:hypothetical protein
MGTPKDNGEETLLNNLQICSLCNRLNRGDGRWSSMGNMRIPPRTKVAQGLCLDCCENLDMSFLEMKSFLVDKPR